PLDPRHRQVGAQVEELVLDPRQLPVTRLDLREPQQRVQLVDLAVRTHEPVELRHARPVAERRLAAVAASRVDPRQPDRLIPLPRHDGTLGDYAAASDLSSGSSLYPTPKRVWMNEWRGAIRSI